MNIRDKHRWLSTLIPNRLKTLSLDIEESQAIAELWIKEYAFDDAGALHFSKLLFGGLKHYPEKTSVLIDWLDAFYRRYPEAVLESANQLLMAPEAHARHLFLLWMSLPEACKKRLTLPLTPAYIERESKAPKPKSLAATYIWKRMDDWFSERSLVGEDIYAYGVDKLWQSWCYERRRYPHKMEKPSFVEAGIRIFNTMDEHHQCLAASNLCRMDEDHGMVRDLLESTPNGQRIRDRLALEVNTPENWIKRSYVFTPEVNFSIFRRLLSEQQLTLQCVNVFRDLIKDADIIPQDIVDVIVNRFPKQRLMNEWISKPNHALLSRIFSKVSADELNSFLDHVAHHNALKLIKRMAGSDSFYDGFAGHRGFQEKVIAQLCSPHTTPGNQWMLWQTNDVEAAHYAWWTLGFKEGEEGQAFDFFVQTVAEKPLRFPEVYAWFYMAGCLNRKGIPYPSIEDVSSISQSLNISVREVLVSTIVDAYSRATMNALSDLVDVNSSSFDFSRL